MAKTAAYGISNVTIDACGANGAYPTFLGASAFSFKAIVKDSVQFNDAAASDNDIEIEDSDDMYASLPGSAATRGFTMDTYDMGKEAYEALMQYTTNGDWEEAPAKVNDLIKAVQIITKEFDDFPSKTFQWAKMKIKVTRAGTIGKSGFPNLHLEFRELMNANAAGQPISGHRWKLTTPVVYTEVDSTQTGYSTMNPSEEGWFERTGSAGNYNYRATWDITPVDDKTYYEVAAQA